MKTQSFSQSAVTADEAPASARWKKRYTSIQKVSWDALWHAVFTSEKGEECWDRMEEAEALKLASKLGINPESDLSELTPIIKRNLARMATIKASR